MFRCPPENGALGDRLSRLAPMPALLICIITPLANVVFSGEVGCSRVSTSPEEKESSKVINDLVQRYRKRED
jgi:hypothetical protein